MRPGSGRASGTGLLRTCVAPTLLVALYAFGCSEEGRPPPRENLPYRLEAIREFRWSPIFADLNGDGRDELLDVYEPSGRRPQDVTSVLIRTHEGEVIDQLNYTGFVGRPRGLDLEGDGQLEIFVPVVRNDTLHLSVADAAGNKLFGFPLTTGQPRTEPEGELPWDPGLTDQYLLDLTGDGSRELVSVITTGFAPDGRGVLVHELPGGRPLGALNIGAPPNHGVAVDLGAQTPTLIVGTWATDNGGEAGGFDDRHAYVIAVDLAPSLEVRWYREVGGIGTRVWIDLADMDRDGMQDLLIVRTGDTGSLVEFADPRTGASFRSRQRAETTFPLVGDWDDDGAVEAVAIAGDSALIVLGADLELERRVELSFEIGHLSQWPDMDGDGRRELVIGSPSPPKILLLNEDLEFKASWPGMTDLRLLRRGAGRAPLLVGATDRGTIGFQLVRNRWHLLWRFGPPALATLGPIAIFVIIGMYARARLSSRLHEAVVSSQIAEDSGPILVLDRRSRIRWSSSETLITDTGNDDRKADPPLSIGDLRRCAPGLADFCESLRESDVLGPVDTWLHLSVDDGTASFHVIARPMRIGARGDPHWVVRCRRASPGFDPQQSANWALLARRVAHDVKNPLSGILLTLDRMRNAVGDRAPEAGETVNAYANRIEERIEQLRRMSNNFLKFIDAEEANRDKRDLSEVIRSSMIPVSQTVPDDIRIRMKLSTAPLPVLVDLEQFHSVVENLVANAVNAMVDGGTLVIRTDLARSLLLSQQDGPRDYGVLEVRDTGTGITDELLPRLFDPGFSTTEHGSGLGLAIVHKIVEDHNGEVSVESDEGVGTVFSVYLPLCTDVD